MTEYVGVALVEQDGVRWSTMEHDRIRWCSVGGARWRKVEYNGA